MRNCSKATLLSLFGVVITTSAAAQSYPQLSGTVETYFLNNKARRGFVNQLWWTELNARISDRDKITGSYILTPGGHSYDELYYRRDFKDVSLRLGRMRPALGLNTWADLFYTGFNGLPLIRSIKVLNNLGIGGDDSGIEATTHIGSVQLQAAAFDNTLDREQIIPDNLNHATLRAQQTVGNLIAAGDFYTSDKGDQKVYGLDLRYTMPQLLMRGEAFWGVGDQPSSGFYVDASYRIPSLYRTQVVARFDQVSRYDQKVAQLETLGVRQVVNRYLSLNVNYAFGSNVSGSSGPYGTSGALATTGWSARAMFQFAF